jgi:FMN-dependent NADH-azoreductase
VGITDVTFVRAEKIGYGPEARDASLAQAKLEISTLAGRERIEAVAA